MYAAEFENFEFEDEFEDEFESEFEERSLYRPFSAQEEMELAAELLEVTSDEELEQFLGNLIKKAARGVSKFARSSVGRKIGGILKGVAKKALPVAGAALGNLVAPGVGGAIGGKLGSFASSLFEMEMEGMSPEDMEFETARRVVRLAGAASAVAARNRNQGSSSTVARNAIKQAARLHAPGLLHRSMPQGGATSGRWVRKGRNILLIGV